MADLPGTQCEGGCRRHWTVEWVNLEDKTEWRLCDLHSERSSSLLGSLGFDPIPRAEGA